MRDYISRPQSKAYSEAHAATFGEGLTRSRWLDEGRDDETFAEWKERMRGRQAESATRNRGESTP